MPHTSASGSVPFRIFIMLFHLEKQIIILLRLPRAGPHWFKESDDRHVGSSISSVMKGILNLHCESSREK